MAQKIITLCDPHLSEHDEEVPGEPYRVGIQEPGGRWRFLEIDLCKADAAEMGQFATWIDQYGREFDPPREPGRRGRKPGPRPRIEEAGEVTRTVEPGTFPCPVCDYVGRTKSALTSHAPRVHGKRLAELSGEPMPFVCEACGKGFTRSQGLGVHKRTQHPDA
jgi:hypothetical protein